MDSKATVSTTSFPPQQTFTVENQSEDDSGGSRAQAAVVGGFLTAMATYGYVNTFGVYQDYFTRSNVASASAISWIGSTQVFLILAGALPAGKLLDMGYFRQTTLVGSLIYVFSNFMLSICNPSKYYQLYLSQGLGMGIGAGLLYAPCIAIQAHHWRSRRALAMGIVAVGSSVGGIIFPIILNKLFAGPLGFHWAVRVTAFMNLAFLLIANALMTHANPPRQQSESRATSKPSIQYILKDVPYVFAAVASVFIDWGLFFPYFYLQLFAILHGIDSNIAFYTLAIMNATGILGRIIPNIIADRFGVYNAIIPCVIACAILVFALLAIKTVASVVVFSVLYGFTSGGFLSLCGPAVAVLCKSPDEVGLRFGFAYFLSAWGALLSGPINGALVGRQVVWLNGILFSGISFIVGCLCLVTTRQMLVERRATQQL